jgi:uncharacterized protein
MTAILTYALILLVGLSLGLVGSGGSVLLMPILVYLWRFPPSVATTYALFIVGIAAALGSLRSARSDLLDRVVLLYFGVPSVVAIFVMRKILLPLLPHELCHIGDFVLRKDALIMFTFAVLMLLAAISMIRKNNVEVNNTVSISDRLSKTGLILPATLIGLLTGFVGVGGGFLMIPTLIFRAKMPMKTAVANSLVLIAANALIGFLGSLGTVEMDWWLLLRFSTCAVIGIFAGLWLSQRMSNERLKTLFGWVILAIGIFVLVNPI